METINDILKEIFEDVDSIKITDEDGNVINVIFDTDCINDCNENDESCCECECECEEEELYIIDVIFSEPATIVFWSDGSKTVVKTQNGEPFDKEKGLAMAFIKKLTGNTGRYNELFKEWCE